MTAESVLRSALTLIGEQSDSTCFTEAALCSLQRIVLETQPLYTAYLAAYGQENTPEKPICCLSDELPCPTVLFPAFVYALASALCHSYNAEYADVLAEKYRAVCRGLWEVLPATVHPVQDCYSE